MGISKTSKEKSASQACCMEGGGGEGSVPQRIWGGFELFWLTSLLTLERELPLDFSSSSFTTNQYKAATELQLCIVPTDFRILCNGPSAAAGEGGCSWGGGWWVRSLVPPASEVWKQWAMQTQSWSLSRQQGPSWSLTEGPVYSNNSTRPGCLSRSKAPGARIHTEPPSVPHLPSQLGWEGRAKKERQLQTPAWASHFRQGPGALTPQTQGLWGTFCICYLNWASLLQGSAHNPSSKKLSRSSHSSELAHPSTVMLGLLEKEVGGQWGVKGLAAPMSAGTVYNVYFKLSGFEEWPTAINPVQSNPIQSNSSFYTYRYGRSSENISLGIGCSG